MAEEITTSEKMTKVVSEIVAQLIQSHESGEDVNLTRWHVLESF